MKKPVLTGELAPNVAIQYRYTILQIQNEINLAWMECKNYFSEMNYQSYYGWIGVGISTMSSAPVFKGLDEILKLYQKITNMMDGKPDLDSFKELEKIQFDLNEIIKESPIYDFEFQEEEVTVLSAD